MSDRISYAVASSSNPTALALNLSSVLNGRELPNRVTVYLNGEVSSLYDFYLEQMGELARFKGVDFSVRVVPNDGIRKTRQRMLDESCAPYLWMGDDDSLFTPQCLGEYKFALGTLHSYRSRLGYLAGCKPDLNNRRNHPNFGRGIRPESELIDYCSVNHFYERSTRLPETVIVDTGNCFIDAENCRESDVTFIATEPSLNCGGEDWLFGMLAYHKGLRSFFAPNALAYHLDQPRGSNFDNRVAVREYLMRACKTLGIDTTRLVQTYETIYGKEGTQNATALSSSART